MGFEFFESGLPFGKVFIENFKFKQEVPFPVFCCLYLLFLAADPFFQTTNFDTKI